MSEQLMGNPLYDPPTVLKSELDRAERKWEFRYENQDRRIKDAMELIFELRKTIRELKREIKDFGK